MSVCVRVLVCMCVSGCVCVCVFLGVCVAVCVAVCDVVVCACVIWRVRAYTLSACGENTSCDCV